MKSRRERIAEILEKDPFSESLSRILGMPHRQVMHPLFSLLYCLRETVRWRAITALGRVVVRQAEMDRDWARTVMRRLMWNLNDESGGIGWGSAEAMGEICAGSDSLSSEFSKILVAYIDPRCNFIDNEALQSGILWGIGRIAQARPEALRGSAALLLPFLRHTDPVLRGLAAWAAAPLKAPCIEAQLSALSKDSTPITLFVNGEPIQASIRDLAFTSDEIPGVV